MRSRQQVAQPATRKVRHIPATSAEPRARDRALSGQDGAPHSRPPSPSYSWACSLQASGRHHGGHDASGRHAPSPARGAAPRARRRRQLRPQYADPPRGAHASPCAAPRGTRRGSPSGNSTNTAFVPRGSYLTRQRRSGRSSNGASRSPWAPPIAARSATCLHLMLHPARAARKTTALVR